MEEIFWSREKFYCFNNVVYVILPHKIVQLYCTSDLRKYKRGKYENGNRYIKTENGIKLKNGFDLHRKFLEAIDYSRNISKKRFPLNYSLETEN